MKREANVMEIEPEEALETPEARLEEPKLTGSESPDAPGGGESLERYLREVSRWSLLTAEAERDLARRTAKGDPAALEEMINRNLRLVVYWARRYRSAGLPMQDLIQEGNLGLMRAAEKFDPRKRTRFSTYASWWIRQALARAICDRQHLIRIPVHMHQKLKIVDRILESSGTNDRTDSDIETTVDNLGIVPYKEWESARRLQQPISLDRQQDPDRDRPIEIEDLRAVNPLREIYLSEIRDQVANLLNALPPRHQAVLKLRYGLEGESEHTLEAIGLKLRVSRERVRQIQTEAVERIAEMIGLPKPGPPLTRRRVAPRSLTKGGGLNSTRHAKDAQGATARRGVSAPIRRALMAASSRGARESF